MVKQDDMTLTNELNGSDILRSFLTKNNLPCDDVIINKFKEFYELLVDHNSRTNLIGLSGELEIYDALFCDSLVVAALTSLPEKIIDVGTGAGFPGIPLAILSKYGFGGGSSFTLVEPREKRFHFLKIAIEELGLDNVTPRQSRINQIKHPEADLAVSKAFLPPLKWINVALKLVKNTGKIGILYSYRFHEDIVKAVEEKQLRVVNESLDITDLGIRKTNVVRSTTIVERSQQP